MSTLYRQAGTGRGNHSRKIGTIAREMSLSVSTVKRAINDLENNGFLRKKQRWRENGGRSSLLYKILKQTTRGYCVDVVNHGMVRSGLCREGNTLTIPIV